MLRYDILTPLRERQHPQMSAGDFDFPHYGPVVAIWSLSCAVGGTKVPISTPHAAALLPITRLSVRGRARERVRTCNTPFAVLSNQFLSIKLWFIRTLRLGGLEPPRAGSCCSPSWRCPNATGCSRAGVCLHKHGALVRLAQSAAEDDRASARAQALVCAVVAALAQIPVNVISHNLAGSSAAPMHFLESMLWRAVPCLVLSFAWSAARSVAVATGYNAAELRHFFVIGALGGVGNAGLFAGLTALASSEVESSKTTNHADCLSRPCRQR